MNKRCLASFGVAMLVSSGYVALGDNSRLGGAPAADCRKLEGPYPLLVTPWTESAALDVATLVKEAEYVDGSGVGGIIWPTAGEVAGLDAEGEYERGLTALAERAADKARPFNARLTAICPGKDSATAIARVAKVEAIAKRTGAKMVILARPPDDATNQTMIAAHYRALGKATTLPVIIQTYNGKSPQPDVSLIVELAKENPRVFGWVKEESPGDKVNERMEQLLAHHEIHGVFSGWGAKGFIYQGARIGTCGCITQRPAYGWLFAKVWERLKLGKDASDPQLAEAYSKYLYMINLGDVFSKAGDDEMRGPHLYVLQRLGIFKNRLTRTGKPGKWKVKNYEMSDKMKAEVESRMKYVFGKTVSAARWNGKPIEEQVCRVSAIPFNRVWSGYQRSKDQTKLTRFVSFDVERPGVFTWALPAGAKSARIRPFRRDQGVVKNGSLEVAISRPEQFVIESGGEELHVFADAPWRYEPRPGDRYFGPGEHDAGAIIPKNGERIVLDRGAVVYGNFVLAGVTNVTIEGRGILDSSRIRRAQPDWPGVRHLETCGIPGVDAVWGASPVYANRSRGISISGIVFRDSPRWTMDIIDSRDIVIDGVKLVGMWRYNADGIDICACENVVIRNSFIRSYDDCVISRPQIGAYEETEMKNMTVSNCVLWCDWGCNMKVQHAQRPALVSALRFRDIDCVNVDATAIVVTTRWGSSDSRIYDVSFDDIRIDAPSGQFCQEHQRSDDHVFSRKVKDSVSLARVGAYSLGKPAANQGKPGAMDPNFFKFDYRDLAFRDFRVYDRPGHLIDDSSTITPKLSLQTAVPRHTISNVILSGLPAKTKVTQRGNVTGVQRHN